MIGKRWEGLTRIPSFNYHMGDLMEPKSEKVVVLYPPMVPLYLDYIIKTEFNER